MVEAAYYCINSNASSSVCAPCSLGCLTCSSASACSSCAPLYLPSSNANGSFCEADCSGIANCTLCHVSSNATLCDACTVGRGVSNNTCSPVCGDGVLLGSEECDDGNIMNGDGCSSICMIENGWACNTAANSSTVCNQCVGATFQAANKTTCDPCANYDCSTCDSSGNCLSCNATSHRQLDPNTSRCLPASGYYEDNSSFVAPACDPSCSSCTAASSASCLSCAPGRVLNGTECPTCIAAAGPGCSSCANNGTKVVCSSCAGGTLSAGSCVFDAPSPPDGPNMLLIILLAALGALLLLCCCLILFCCWRRRKNEENKVQEEEELVREAGQKEEPNPFDEKLMDSNKKSKYRGAKQSNEPPRIKKRSPVPLPQET
jgi:cysteine-rich repeat protein